LLVRTVLVPALVRTLGDRFWLPGHPARTAPVRIPPWTPTDAHTGPDGTGWSAYRAVALTLRRPRCSPPASSRLKPHCDSHG
jgi:hypothetical protein